MTTKEKAAYLKGLADGLGMLDDSKSGRVLSCIIDILGELSSDVEDIEDSVFSLSEEVEQLGVDLDEVGDILCGEDEDEKLRSCCSSCCCDEDEDEDEDEDDEEPVFYEITCPACGEDITVDEDVLDLGSIPCPKCGENLEFDFDYDPDEDEAEEDEEDAD